MPNHLSRRAFLGQAGTVAALAVANPVVWGRPGTSPVRPMRLGGPIFLKSEDPAELAQEHRRLGYRAAYAPQVEINDTDRIKAIIKEFAARDVALAEVGAWRNMLDPDLEKRRQNLAYVQERLALAELLARAAASILPALSIPIIGTVRIPKISARSLSTPPWRTAATSSTPSNPPVPSSPLR